MSGVLDVLVVGAGPAGAVAATLVARAGARVSLVDRATFPRDKLCGDTVNPGTLGLLRRLKLAEALDARGLALDGMIVTGESGIAIEGPYPPHLFGRSLVRAELDWALLRQAIAAGAEFEPGISVREAVIQEYRGGRIVGGAIAGSNGRSRSLPARVVIAADGRHSSLAFSLNLARHPASPRRWAIGAHFADVSSSSRGEMHIRRGRYIGVAPLPDGITNVCLVKPVAYGSSPDFGHPEALLRRELDRDPALRDRFTGARLVRAPIVLGPLAVDTASRSIDGLILAGDAAGFVDPMTGDGLRFAVRGGELAAHAALDALAHGWPGVHARLAADRQREFGGKWRFNRFLRALVSSPAAIGVAARAARLTPGVVRAIVRKAGDCDLV